MPDTAAIDLSHWNQVDDCAAVAGAGVIGVIHKATEGTDYIDPTYDQRRRDARDNGLMWGAYHFLRPGDMTMQAQWFVANAQPDPDTLMAADHEDDGVSLNDLKQFMSEVARLIGRPPVLYSGNVIKQQIGNARDEEMAQYRLWLAQYSATPSWPTATWPSWWLWQYTGNGSCAGIAGDCDCNAYQGVDLAAEWSGSADAVIVPDDNVPVITMAISVPDGVELHINVNGEALM